MTPLLRQCAALCAVAAVLAYVGLISLTDMRDYVPWPANMLALSLAAALCGMLLALAEPKALLLSTIAPFISVPIFGAFWALATWMLLGPQLSFADLILSDLVLLYIVQRGFLLVAPTFVFGLLGALGVQLLLPRLLRR